MFYPELDYSQAYEIGPSNGSAAVSQFHLDEENMFIAIENVAMFGGEVFLRDAPSRTRLHEKAQAHPAVVASLKRSLKEHADIWAELSKY